MADLKNHIRISKDFPRETFQFLMDCEGYTVASKYLSKMVQDYADLRYRAKNLERENQLLRQKKYTK